MGQNEAKTHRELCLALPFFTSLLKVFRSWKTFVLEEHVPLHPSMVLFVRMEEQLWAK